MYNHGHELRGEMLEGWGGQGGGGIKGENWKNCISIINKKYLKIGWEMEKPKNLYV